MEKGHLLQEIKAIPQAVVLMESLILTGIKGLVPSTRCSLVIGVRVPVLTANQYLFVQFLVGILIFFLLLINIVTCENITVISSGARTAYLVDELHQFRKHVVAKCEGYVTVHQQLLVDDDRRLEALQGLHEKVGLLVREG